MKKSHRTLQEHLSVHFNANYIQGSIHGVGKDLQGAPSCNGWTFWYYDDGGEVKSVDTARELYRLANED